MSVLRVSVSWKHYELFAVDIVDLRFPLPRNSLASRFDVQTK